MPERKGVQNIADELLRRWKREGQALPSPIIICNIPEVSLTAKQGPVPPKRAGAHAFCEPGCSGAAAHKVTRAKSFQELRCTFAQLCNSQAVPVFRSENAATAEQRRIATRTNRSRLRQKSSQTAVFAPKLGDGLGVTQLFAPSFSSPRSGSEAPRSRLEERHEASKGPALGSLSEFLRDTVLASLLHAGPSGESPRTWNTGLGDNFQHSARLAKARPDARVRRPRPAAIPTLALVLSLGLGRPRGVSFGRGGHRVSI